MKKTPKVLLMVVGSIVVVLLTALLLVSPIAKNYLERHDKELIGRELSIGQLRVNLLLGSAKLKEATLMEDDGITPFVSFDRLEAKIRLRDLLNNRIWVKRALLSGLKVNVEQKEDWFNFNSLKDHFASIMPIEKPSFGWILNDIRIDKGTVRYADLTLGNEFLLRDIALHLPNIDFSNLKTDFGLDMNLADDATLHTDFRLSDNAERYALNFKLQHVDIEAVEPYLQQYCPVDLMGGFVNVDVEMKGSSEHILDFDLTGNLVLNEVRLQDMEGHPLASVDSVFAKIRRFQLSDKKIAIDNLYLSGLNAAYTINPDSTTNLDFVWDSRFSNDSTEAVGISDTLFADNEEKTSWDLQIADLRLDKSKVSFEDQTLPQVFRYEVSDINMSARNFSNEGHNAIQLQSALNKVGKLNLIYLIWQGDLHGRDNHNLTLMLNNVKVADFSPYTVQMFGIPMESGTLSFQSQNIISDGHLNGVNKLQIAAPKAGDKVKKFQPQYAKVPLKLGLYLLTDKHHNVSLDLPVTGDLNDPSFSYRKTIVKVFSNLLTKAAASPFRLMTDEDNNLKYIPFDPLQADFTPEQYVMIDNVVTTLQNRSDLAIVLEEQVQYDEVVKELCVMQLKRDFYLSLHPETSISSPTKLFVP